MGPNVSLLYSRESGGTSVRIMGGCEVDVGSQAVLGESEVG